MAVTSRNASILQPGETTLEACPAALLPQAARAARLSSTAPAARSAPCSIHC